MKRNSLNELFIQKLYNEFQIEYKLSLPKINKIIWVSKSDDFWAEIKHFGVNHNVRNLYITEELFQQNDIFIKQTLYHEFSHIADGIQFLSYNEKDFNSIMIFYSEVHASEIQMDYMLRFVENELSLKSIIMYEHAITIEDFLNQTQDIVRENLEKTVSSNPDNFIYDIKDLFYFWGYIKSITKHKISYDYLDVLLCPFLAHIIIPMKDIAMKNYYATNDYEEMLKLMNEFDNSITTSVLTNAIHL